MDRVQIYPQALKNINKSIFLCVLTILVMGQLTTVRADNTYSIAVTIQNTNINSDLSYFPVYIDLSTMPETFWNTVSADGSDLRVFEADGVTETPFELVSINTVSKTGELHFLADILSSTSDTNFFIYYGDKTIQAYESDDIYGSDNVWGTDYLMVHHLEDVPSTTNHYVLDSTGHAYDGLVSGNMTMTDSVIGQLAGKALQFDGIDDIVSWTDANVYNLALNATFTISVWVFVPEGSEITSNAAWGFAGNDDLGFYPYDDFYCWSCSQDGNGVRMFWRNLGGNLINENGVTRSGAWHHFVMVNESETSRRIEVDGVVIGTSGAVGAQGSFDSFNIGGRGENDQYLFGTFDEVRLLTRAVSSDWVDAEYTNQHSPGAFYSLSSPVLVSGNQAPVLSPIGDQTILENQLLTFTVSATDPDGDMLTFSATNTPAGSIFDTNTGIFSWTPGFDQSGYYPDLEFTVLDDGYPMELDVELINITVGNVNTPPVINPIPPIVSMENELIEVPLNVIDPDGDQIVLSANYLPVGAYFDNENGILTWIPDQDQAGNYSISITALDNGFPELQSQIDIIISVGDVLMPSEQSEDLINDVMVEDFPNSQENSYMANLKKVEVFIEEGKIKSAIQQILSFISKVEQDRDQGDISSNTASTLIIKAQQLLLNIVARPDLKLPLPGGDSWRLTVEVGGKADDGVDDIFHKANSSYYSLDFVDDKDVNGVKTHVDDVKILAAGNGRVFSNGWSTSYGNVVVIDHDYPFDGTGYTTVYAHLKNKSSLEEGQSVAQGNLIGIMGTTPGGIYSTGIHLHFQVSYNNSSTKSTMDKLGGILIDGLAIEDYKVGSLENPQFYPSSQW